MTDAKEVIESLMKVEGAIAAMIVDSDSGMILASKSNNFDAEIAAAGNTRVVQAKRDTMKMLGLDDQLEDILVTLSNQLHLIAPLPNNPVIFGYLVVDKAGANLAMARAQLKKNLAALTV